MFWCTGPISNAATEKPRMAAAIATSAHSVNSCASRRRRGAPTAERTASSRRRATKRASTRLARLAAATSNKAANAMPMGAAMPASSSRSPLRR